MMINKYYEGSENEDFEKEVTCAFASLTLVKVMGRGNYIWEKRNNSKVARKIT